MERRREEEFRNARGRRGERWEEDTTTRERGGDGRFVDEPRSAVREKSEYPASEPWREGRFPSGDERWLRERDRREYLRPERDFEGRQMGEPFRGRGGQERDDDGGFRRFDRYGPGPGYASARFGDTSPFSESSQGRFAHDYAQGASGGLNPGSGLSAGGPSEYGFYEPSWRQGPFAGKGPAGYTRSDARIEEDVCDRLTERGDIDASHVRIQVRGGEVTLEGDVHDRRTKRAAEDVAESVGGVRQVHNQLRIETHSGAPEPVAGEPGKSGRRRRR